MSTKIHFLNTGHSDCIIIESNGLIAMVDAAEDTEYPADKPNLNLQGYEDIVVDYLIKNFSGGVENNKVNIEFVLGTHSHSDHIGGFDTVINHPLINVKKAYLKPYKEENIIAYERNRWDNVEVYTQMLNAIEDNDVTLVESFDNEKVKLGDVDITFFNGTYRKRSKKFGENINSVVTLLECFGRKILLAGDLNYEDGDEKLIASKIGKVDVLKVGHHGYIGSTSAFWAKTLSPEYAVVCNWSKRIYPDVRFKLKYIAKAKILATADVNGVIIDLSSDGQMNILKDIMNY